MARRLLLLLVFAALGVAGYVAVGLWTKGVEPDVSSTSVRVPAPAPPSPAFEAAAPSHPGAPSSGSCEAPPEAAAAATSNAVSLTTAQGSAFGRSETGWSVYVPLISREVDTPCRPDQAGFAKALQTWQAAHGVPATGVVGADTLRALDIVWLRRRPFVAATRNGACPAPPPGELLVTARPDEGYLGKAVRVHVRALAAFRRLVAAARSDLPQLAADPRLLTIVSAYRGPDEEAARCMASASCGTASMARCSSHRTGLALDLFLGSPPGLGPTSSDDGARATLSQSPTYRWLVANADRFGFSPYPFEPWHWEYTRAEGAPDDPPPLPPPPSSGPSG